VLFITAGHGAMAAAKEEGPQRSRREPSGAFSNACS